MAFPTVTYTFVNATVADATQINLNFSNILSGLSDGTKDISIKAATFAGTVTMTAPSAFSTSGIYFGNSGFTIQMLAPTLAANWIFTLPINAPTVGQVLSAATASTTAWIPIPISSDAVINCGISSSASGSVLTVNATDASGATPSASSQISINFRNVTITSGTIVTRTVSAALSMTVNSGATLGLTTSQNQYVWVYAIDNAGTVELAVSGNGHWDQTRVQSTTAVTAGATDQYTLYSTTARTNIPIRLIGRLLVNEASFWASSPAEIASYIFHVRVRSEVWVRDHTGLSSTHGSTNTAIQRYATTVRNVGTAITYADSATNGGSFTINEDGIYAITMSDYQSAGANGNFGVTVNSNQLTTTVANITEPTRIIWSMAMPTLNSAMGLSCTLFLKTGDVVRAHDDTSANFTSALGQFRITRVGL